MSPDNNTTNSEPSIIVPLSRGMVALISECDADIVLPLKWCVVSPRPTGPFYGFRNFKEDGARRGVLLHRFILGEPDGVMIDHKNGNGLDCRRSNMRTCTHAQNQANREKHKSGVSAFKGVRRTKSGRWFAEAFVDRKAHRSHVVETEEEAARLYDEMAIELFGEFARLNF